MFAGDDSWAKSIQSRTLLPSWKCEMGGGKNFVSREWYLGKRRIMVCMLAGEGGQTMSVAYIHVHLFHSVSFNVTRSFHHAMWEGRKKLKEKLCIVPEFYNVIPLIKELSNLKVETHLRHLFCPFSSVLFIFQSIIPFHLFKLNASNLTLASEKDTIPNQSNRTFNDLTKRQTGGSVVGDDEEFAFRFRFIFVWNFWRGKNDKRFLQRIPKWADMNPRLDFKNILYHHFLS